MNEEITCAVCGRVITADELENAEHLSDGDYVCEECVNDGEVVRCECCGEAILNDDSASYRVNGRAENILLCPSCVEDSTEECGCCGEIVYTRRFGLREVREPEQYICDRCESSEDYHYCDSCGNLFHEDYISWDDYREEYVCNDCRHDDSGRVIHDYHDYPSGHRFDFKSLFEERNGLSTDDVRSRVLHMGTELELDDGGEDNDNAEQIINAQGLDVDDDVLCFHDGSLNNGFEMVSNPATLAYHMTKYHIDKAMTKAKELGYTSHDRGTCGLHVHIDRKYFDDAFEDPEIAATILLINNQEWLKKFSRRKSYGYCNFPHTEGSFEVEDFKTDEESTMRIVRDLRSYMSGHNRCLNFDGYSTMEFRFFRGTLLYSTYIASLQLVEMFAYAMKHLRKEQLAVIDFKWFKRYAKRKNYKEFLEYSDSRGITVNP